MSIFKPEISFEVNNSDTIIGADAYVQGSITVKGSIRIDGRLEGSINDALLVTVGPQAVLKGNITCESCFLCGDMTGNIKALEYAELGGAAKLKGNISTPSLSIEQGALFNGNCAMKISDPEKNSRQSFS